MSSRAKFGAEQRLTSLKPAALGLVSESGRSAVGTDGGVLDVSLSTRYESAIVNEQAAGSAHLVIVGGGGARLVLDQVGGVVALFKRKSQQLLWRVAVEQLTSCRRSRWNRAQASSPPPKRWGDGLRAALACKRGSRP